MHVAVLLTELATTESVDFECLPHDAARSRGQCTDGTRIAIKTHTIVAVACPLVARCLAYTCAACWVRSLGVSLRLDTVQHVNWSTRAVIPEGVVPPIAVLKGFELDRIGGRSGDLLVIRVQNSSRLSPAKWQCLRSLNLRQIGSAALCRSDLPNTWGMIEAVKDHVAVIEFDSIINLERKPTSSRRGVIGKTSSVEYEHLRYGTRTQPGELVRDRDGRYFAFESDRNGVRLMWGSRVLLGEALAAFLKAYDSPAARVGADASLLVSYDAERSREIIETSTAKAVSHLRTYISSIVFARLAFSPVEFTWQAAHRPFDDMAVESTEVGVNCGARDLDLESARRFAARTGDPQFFSEADCRVEVRQHGIMRAFRF